MYKKMGLTFCSLMLCVPAAFSSLAAAQNRQSTDAIFNEPRGSAVAQILYTAGDLIAFQIVRPKLPSAAVLNNAEARLVEIAASNRPEAERLAARIEAETDIARARLAALQSLEGGVIPVVIKYARIVGTTLVIFDVAGRAWVWGALNANPTWSPAITAMQFNSDKLSRRNALPER